MATYDVSTLGSPLEFDTTMYRYGVLGRLSDTRFVMAWQQSTTVKNVQAFDVNPSTGAITALSSPLNFYSTTIGWSAASRPTLQVYDATHFIITWADDASDGRMRSFQLDGGGAITAWGSELEFDTTNAISQGSCMMDSTHMLVAWRGAADDGFAQVFTLNTGTGALTAEGSSFEWQTTEADLISVAKLSSTKVLVCLKEASTNDLAAKVLDVNTSTWAVGNAGSESNLQATITVVGNNVITIDDSISPIVAIDFYGSSTGTPTGQILRQIQVNTSTWAVSTLGTQSNISGDFTTNRNLYAIQKIDSTHFIVFYTGGASSFLGTAATYEINTSTGALTELSTTTFTAAQSGSHSSVKLTDSLYIIAYSDDASSDDGFVQSISVVMTTPTSIKTVDGLAEASVKTVDDLANASVKTINGLA